MSKRKNSVTAVVLTFIIFSVTVSSGLPELAESIEWKFHRNLYDYRMYGSITLERIDVPLHTLLVNLTFNVQASNSDCPVKYVKIYANQFGLPVVSRDNETFPSAVYVSATPVLNVTVTSTNQSVVWTLEHQQAGQLFLMAVMPPPDSRIKQQGLGEECLYSLSIRAKILYYLEEDLPQLLPGTPQTVTLYRKGQTLLSFSVPRDTMSYSLSVVGCNDRSSCPLNVSVGETLSWHGTGFVYCQWTNGSCLLEVLSPLVDTYNYLSLNLLENVTLNLTVHLETSFCDMNPAVSELMTTATAHSTCVFVGDLGRETPEQAEESSNFNDHFVVWDDNLNPHPVINVNTSDLTVLITRFKLRTSDTGTSLKVNVHVPIDQSSPFAHTTLCLRPHRLSNNECDGGAAINVTNQKSLNKDHVIVPYPQSGYWFISLKSCCFQIENKSSSEVPVPCQHYPMVSVTVHLAPCIDGRCGSYGTCKLYFGADILYSACSCFSGWRGYGCNDGSHASSASSERAAVFLLTLSNLGFLPAIGLALTRKFYIEALVYAYNMFFSTFYHACDSSEVYQLCILPYNALSFADFFASLLSFWVTLMAMARIPQHLRSFLHMLSALLISLGEVYDRHGLVEQLLPLVAGVAIVLISWGIECYRRKSLFPSKRRLIKFILPGILLSCLGLILNLALETESNYKFLHSFWHLLESGAIIFLLPPRRRTTVNKSSHLSVQSGDITRQGLLDDDEFQANIHRADHITSPSPLGSPSPPQTPRNNREFKLVSRGQRNPNLVL